MSVCHLQPPDEEDKLDDDEERQKQVQLRELTRGCLVNIFIKKINLWRKGVEPETL